MTDGHAAKRDAFCCCVFSIVSTLALVDLLIYLQTARMGCSINQSFVCSDWFKKRVAVTSDVAAISSANLSARLFGYPCW